MMMSRSASAGQASPKRKHACRQVSRLMPQHERAGARFKAHRIACKSKGKAKGACKSTTIAWRVNEAQHSNTRMMTSRQTPFESRSQTTKVGFWVLTRSQVPVKARLIKKLASAVNYKRGAVALSSLTRTFASRRSRTACPSNGARARLDEARVRAASHCIAHCSRLGNARSVVRRDDARTQIEGARSLVRSVLQVFASRIVSHARTNERKY